MRKILSIALAVLCAGCASPLKQLTPMVKELAGDQAAFKLTIVAAGISVTLDRAMPTNYIPTWYVPTNAVPRK